MLVAAANAAEQVSWVAAAGSATARRLPTGLQQLLMVVL